MIKLSYIYLLSIYYFFRLEHGRNFSVFGPLYKALLLKNKTVLHEHISSAATDTFSSYNYIVTKPTFLHNFNSSKIISVTELSVVESENTTTNKNISTNSVIYCPDDVSPNLRKQLFISLLVYLFFYVIVSNNLLKRSTTVIFSNILFFLGS